MTKAGMNGGKDAGVSGVLGTVDRPDETDPTNPTEKQREFLSQCFRLSLNWCPDCGEVIDRMGRCGCDY